jgi:hypothetical protein
MTNYVNHMFLPDNKKDYDFIAKKAEKNIKKDNLITGISIDPKRQISSNDKESVWQQATINPFFDETIFRCDPFGSIAIKGLNYNNTTSTQKKFVFDYEHIVAHSENGKSIKENICILNAGINRVKGSKPLTSINFYEFQGLVKTKSITFDQLLEDLENDLHSCCNHYDLYFFKNSQNKWSIYRCDTERKYKNYSSNNTYKPKKQQVVIRQSEELPIEASIVVTGVAVGSFLIVANAIGSQIYKTSEKITTFVENFMVKKENNTEIPEIPKKKEEPSVFTATVIGSLAITALAAGIKMYVDAEFKTEKNKNKRRR